MSDNRPNDELFSDGTPVCPHGNRVKACRFCTPLATEQCAHEWNGGVYGVPENCLKCGARRPYFTAPAEAPTSKQYRDLAKEWNRLAPSTVNQELAIQLFAAWLDGKPAPETTTKQAPIANIIVDENGEIAAGCMYAPGLPPGSHDVYCEPEATAPYMRAEKTSEINQCDGCRRGLPVENGIHRGPGGFWAGDAQACTAHLYSPPKARAKSIVCPKCMGSGGGVTRDGIELDCSKCNGTGGVPAENGK